MTAEGSTAREASMNTKPDDDVRSPNAPEPPEYDTGNQTPNLPSEPPRQQEAATVTVNNINIGTYYAVTPRDVASNELTRLVQ